METRLQVGIYTYVADEAWYWLNMSGALGKVCPGLKQGDVVHNHSRTWIGAGS